MRSLIFVFAWTVVLGACAPARSIRPPGGTACPLSMHETYHEMDIHTEDALPGKLAVILEGQMKYDSCLNPPHDGQPPFVVVSKGDHLLSIRVEDFDAYKTLPQTVSFEIQDRGDCAAQPSTFFKATDVPLNFKKDFPDGPACGSQVHAKVDLNK